MTSKRLVSFCRVSGKNQKNNTSLEDQRERIRYWAGVMDNATIIEEIEAVESATCFTAERKVFRSALDRVAKSDCDGLIVYDLDRFFRNTEEGLRVAREHFLEQGKTLVGLNQNIDISTDDGWFFFGMYLLMAEKEARHSKRRFSNGKTAKQRACEAIQMPAYLAGHPPYGYRTIGTNGQSRLVKDAKTHPWRLQIFAWLAEGKGYSWIARKLTEIEVPTPNCKSQIWNECTIRQMAKRTMVLEPLMLAAENQA